jgi:hypothetical protein
MKRAPALERDDHAFAPTQGHIHATSSRGVDLLVNVLDAADHVEQLTHDEVRRLLNEVAAILCPLLQRDAEILLKQERHYFPRKKRTRQPTQARP